jgi:formiminotetrahydrofolate cyclodeaminase
MNAANSIAERRIGEFLAALGSDETSPGAGAAAGIALALAAACARKAVVISLKHRPAHAPLTRANEQLSEIARQALQGAHEDARRFEEFLRAQDAHGAAKLTRAEVGMQQLAVELLQAITTIENQVAPIVAGDLLAATVLCRAVMAIEAEDLAESVRS